MVLKKDLERAAAQFCSKIKSFAQRRFELQVYSI
jgi:hypothetical protein